MGIPKFTGALASAEWFNLAVPEEKAAWKAWRMTGIGGTAAARMKA